MNITLELLYKFKETKLQIMCLKLIDLLCTLSFNRKHLVQEGKLKDLISWFMKTENFYKSELVEVALNVCTKLAMSAAETKQALQECSGYAFISATNDAFPDNAEIQTLSVTALSSLMEVAAYDTETSDDEILSEDEEERETEEESDDSESGGDFSADGNDSE
eukprot:TRINITY_DN1274_c0_g1_i5.p2 TRINITY_DN1274_c0_g1~~TRINITY_DN1274_c0_g1_i5.p2  ORF type:complete len:163 (-),score=36.66 TRINITY_DN1274_c0_g1_i5:91-579(-)